MDLQEDVNKITCSRSLEMLMTTIKMFEAAGISYRVEKRIAEDGPWYFAIQGPRAEAMLCPYCGEYFWPENKEQSIKHWHPAHDDY